MTHPTPIFGRLWMVTAMIVGLGWALAAHAFSPADTGAFGPLTRQDLGRAYARELRQDIVQTVERITGPDTVSATVHAAVDWETTEEIYHDPHYRTVVRRQGPVIDILDVAVLIDGKRVKGRSGQPIYLERTPSEMRKLTDLIRVIVGFDIDRGDRLIVQNYPLMPVRRHIHYKTLIGGGCLVLLGTLLFGALWGLRREAKRPVAVFGEVLHFVRRHPDLAVRILRRWLTQTHRPNARQYALAERAGVILLSLGQAEIRKVMRHLSADEVKVIKQLIARLGPVAGRDVRESLNLFYREMTKPSDIPTSAMRLPTDLKRWSDIFGLSPDKIRRLLVYCDKAVLAAALQDESPEKQGIFARELSPDLWQSVCNRMRGQSADLSAKEILLKTARKLDLFG